MKVFQSTISILAVLFFTISCSNDNSDNAPPFTVEQNPLPEFLEKTGFNQREIIMTNGNSLEAGFAFTPLVSGKITALVVKLPAVKEDLRVTIWDKENESIVLTETINVISANTGTTKVITPINLAKEKEYIISFSVTQYFRRLKTDGSEVAFPFTIGDIKITSINFKGGEQQAMPKNTGFDTYIGDCSFKFQK